MFYAVSLTLNQLQKLTTLHRRRCLKQLSCISCDSLKIIRENQIIPSMTSVASSFITKYCQHHYLDKSMTQRNKALWPWKVASEYRMWLRACAWVCSGLHYIPKPFHFPCPNKPRTVITVWGCYIKSMTIYFKKYAVWIRTLCPGASHLWKTMAMWVNHCEELTQMLLVNLL